MILMKVLQSDNSYNSCSNTLNNRYIENTTLLPDGAEHVVVRRIPSFFIMEYRVANEKKKKKT